MIANFGGFFLILGNKNDCALMALPVSPFINRDVGILI